MSSGSTIISNSHNLTSSQIGTFYFAFGSNLSARQMSLRLTNNPASSVPVALARLDHYKWIICERGYANVVALPVASASAKTTDVTVNGFSQPHEENVVWGVVYNMSAADEDVLDRYEGHDDFRNPTPEVNPNMSERVWKPFLQGNWDYNKHYVRMTVTKWLRDPREYGVSADMNMETEVRALVYVDELRTTDGDINAEYIGRMNRGIAEAVTLGLSESWVRNVMRKWIVEGVEVDDERYVGTDKGYVEDEGRETLDDVRKRVGKGREESGDVNEAQGGEWSVGAS